jgi:isoamylase
MKNALAMLLTSQGVPMLLMGDEMGRTQYGNNNTYCHDSELNWLDWGLLERYAGLFRFASRMIAFRKAHSVLRNAWHLRNADYVRSGYPDISWHGERPGSRTGAPAAGDSRSCCAASTRAAAASPTTTSTWA